MADGKLRQAMLEAIRDLRARVEVLEAKAETVYDACEKAELALPPCVSFGPRGGCVITRRHALHAWHYRRSVGDTIRYSWGTRKVIDVRQVPGTDIAVATLDADADCEPARRLPWDWERHFPTHHDGARLRRPVVAHAITAVGSLVESKLYSLGSRFGADGTWVRPGDSGQPLWLPTNPVTLIGCWLYAGGSGASVAAHWKELLRVTASGDYADAMMEAELD